MSKYIDESGLGYLWGKVKSYVSGLGFYTKPSTGIPATDIASGVIPTVPSNVSAFNNDAGYITGYTETDPVFAASAAHGITSSDISNWNGKQAAIDDLATIRSGAALGATALQSFTESDPTVPAWAKQSTKPSYTASEVGALPDTTVIPAAPGTLNTTATTAQSTSSSEALSGSITLHKVAKTGTYSDLIGKPTIPTVPTALSAFTDDLGSSPTHTHSQYLTSAPVTSVNGQTGAVSLTIPSAVTESTVTGWGFTKNSGTVTSTGGTTAVNNIQVVSALPASPDANTLYLIPE